MAKETHNKALHLITDLRRENHIRKRRSKHPETRKRRKSQNLAIIAFGFCFCFKVKGEALRILRTNSSKNTIKENISKFKRHLWDRGYPRNLVEKLLSEIKFTRRCSVLERKNKTQKDILPFVIQYRPTVSNLKQTLLTKWHLIQNQPLLCQIFKEATIFSYKKGKSLRDLLVRAKL